MAGASKERRAFLRSPSIPYLGNLGMMHTLAEAPAVVIIHVGVLTQAIDECRGWRRLLLSLGYGC